MNRSQIRISALTLILLPAMFSLGWWARDCNYKRDVYIAAEEICRTNGGTYVPEVGIILFAGDARAKYQAMSPGARAEMDRRMEFYTQEFEPTFTPPKPGIVNSIVSLFSSNDAPVDDGRTVDRRTSNSDPANVEQRIEFFRRLHAGQSSLDPNVTTEQEENGEP